MGGAVCGILAVFAYGVPAAVESLPDRVAIPLIFTFGPLLVVSAIGTYYFIKLHRNSLALQVGTVFQMLAGSLVTMMLCMQQSVFSTFDRLAPLKADPATATAFKTGLQSGNAVQLGADVAWDLFIFPAMVLLGIAMWSHPKLGKIIGSIGIVIGAVGAVLNIWTFPTPPAEAELIDVGPLGALWFLTVAIMVLVGARHADKVTAPEPVISAAGRVNA